MFVDCGENAPGSRDGMNGYPSVTVEDHLVEVEKPYIVLNDDNYELHVPAPRVRSEEKSLGCDLSGSPIDRIRPFIPQRH